MCRTHWRMVPEDLQRPVWRTYQRYTAALAGKTTVPGALQARGDALRDAQALAIAAVRTKIAAQNTHRGGL